MKYFHFSFVLLLCLLTFIPGGAHAQSQSLSVTPPLFQLSIKPGDVWQSSVRVVNTNEFPLSVYAEVVNFVPDGEGGLGKFMPVLDESTAKATIAEWIEIPYGPHVVPAGQSHDVSFFVDVPKDAAPGGHFAAILISTEPPKKETDSLALLTTQTVATLFFTRIEGDVIENAHIREFAVTERSIELPEAEFSLRFENKGNVHLQPRGDIVITNMWGTERGTIPINHDTHFGNVLPTSIRDFRFTWKGERSLADIGRYKAIATLAYGEDGIKSVSSVAYFWVIPVKGALITLAFLISFIALITWAVRSYVRRMLMLAGVDPEVRVNREEKMTESPQRRSYSRVTAPLSEGTLDLRKRLSKAEAFTEGVHTVFDFILLYKRFFGALVLLIVGFIVLAMYAGEVANTETEYEVTINEGGTTRTLTNEEVEGITE